MMALKRQKESNESMFVDELPFRITIVVLAINLLRLTLPKGPFRGFYYYAVKPFFTNASGSRKNEFRPTTLRASPKGKEVSESRTERWLLRSPPPKEFHIC
jgi:hypothetical protein